VNNHNKIKLITTQVGAVLAKNLLPPAAETVPPASEVLVQVDGSHPFSQRINALKRFQPLSIGQRTSVRLISIIDRLRAKLYSVLMTMATMKISAQCGAEAGNG